MILEEGKFYINKHGKVYGPMKKHHNFASTNWMVGADKDDTACFEWYFETSTGRRVIDMHDLTSFNHLIDEYREKESVDAEPSTPIDKVTFAQYRRGIAAIWDSYKIYY